MQGRSLRRWERALAYGVLGVAGEVAFTGARDSLLRKDSRLRGHSYLWMFPIYGVSALLFEPMHDLMRRRPVWERAAAYSVGIMGVECVAGMALRKGVGLVPWDYTGHGRFVVAGGATRLDYAPVWVVVGLALERVDDRLR